MGRLPLRAWLFVGSVVTATGVLLVRTLPVDLEWATLLTLSALFVLCESLPAQSRIKHARVSAAFAVSLASVVLLGSAGALIVGVTALIAYRKPIDPVKRVYNAAQFGISGYLAGCAFAAAGLAIPDGGPANRAILSYVVALTVFVAINLSLTATVLLLSRQITVVTLVREAVPLVASCLAFGMLGLLVAVMWSELGAASAALVLLPLLVARWAFEQYRAEQVAYEATLATLCQAVETKDHYTRGHGDRVSVGAAAIARQLGLSSRRVEAARVAGLMHDVGKLGVPTSVLQKDGLLSEEEYAAVQLHPMRGLEIVRDIGFLDEAKAGIMHHHERIDGRGYPMGLTGDEIPELARVISVADTYDSMTSKRSYREPLTPYEAIVELKRGAGTQLDPAMVAAFVAAFRAGQVATQQDAPPLPTDPRTVTHMDHDDPIQPPEVSAT